MGGSETSCVSGSEANKVRCCADVVGATPGPSPNPTSVPPVPSLAPLVAPTMVPVPTPTEPSPLSMSTCDDLGWGNAESWGSSHVCGESDFNLGGCSHFISWLEAVSFCEIAGARLCSATELQANEARSTGCGIDKVLVWSRDACDGGRTLAMGATNGGLEMACSHEEDAHPARCCADIPKG